MAALEPGHSPPSARQIPKADRAILRRRACSRLPHRAAALAAMPPAMVVRGSPFVVRPRHSTPMSASSLLRSLANIRRMTTTTRAAPRRVLVAPLSRAVGAPRRTTSKRCSRKIRCRADALQRAITSSPMAMAKKASPTSRAVPAALGCFCWRFWPLPCSRVRWSGSTATASSTWRVSARRRRRVRHPSSRPLRSLQRSRHPTLLPAMARPKHRLPARSRSMIVSLANRK